jgi:hypothetical protein
VPSRAKNVCHKNSNARLGKHQQKKVSPNRKKFLAFLQGRAIL